MPFRICEYKRAFPATASALYEAGKTLQTPNMVCMLYIRSAQKGMYNYKLLQTHLIESSRAKVRSGI